MNVQKEIHQWIYENQENGIKLLQTWVDEKSVKGNERGVQELLMKELKKLGLELDMWEPDVHELSQHNHVTTRSHFKGSPNVVGVLKGRGQGKSIILNGHIDVVPEGDSEKWLCPPYQSVVHDGKVYGRGSTDMKGGNLSLLLAIQAIVALGISLKGDVIFQSVVDEECGGAGTLSTLVRGYHGDAAIIPEPTNLKVFIKQQGSMWFRVTVKGLSAHGGTRYEGVSAIEKAICVIDHIRQLETLRNERVNDPLYSTIQIPFPINIGSIKGGDWPSSVPDLVQIEGRIGVSPEETLAHAREELIEWLQSLSTFDPWFLENPVEVEWFGAEWQPGTIEQNHPFTNSLLCQYRNVVKEEAAVEASPWGTDGGILYQVGKIPCIVFGPGTTEMAHQSNEYIEIEKILTAAEIIALTIIDWCEIQT